MSTELKRQDPGDVAEPAPTNMLQAVMAAVRDPAVDPARLKEFLEIGERLEAKQAKREFDLALREMQPELPIINRRGQIKYNATSKPTRYARWDDIHKACMPILQRHGFSCSFSSELQGSNALRVSVRVKHTGGHEEEGAITVPWLDTGGSKSPAQAAASSETLAMRHAFVKYFNILTEEQDDDGSAKGVPERITEAQQMDVLDAIGRFAEKDPKFKERFLKRMQIELKCDNVADLFQGEQFDAVRGWLKI